MTLSLPASIEQVDTCIEQQQLRLGVEQCAFSLAFMQYAGSDGVVMPRKGEPYVQCPY